MTTSCREQPDGPDSIVPVRLSDEDEMSLLILHYGKDQKTLQSVTDVLIFTSSNYHGIVFDRTRVQIPSKVEFFFFRDGNSHW